MQNNEKVLRIGLYKAISIVMVAILSSAGGAFWAGISTANSIVFAVAAHTEQLKDIPNTYVRRDVHHIEYDNIVKAINEIKVDVREINRKLK